MQLLICTAWRLLSIYVGSPPSPGGGHNSDPSCPGPQVNPTWNSQCIRLPTYSEKGENCAQHRERQLPKFGENAGVRDGESLRTPEGVRHPQARNAVSPVGLALDPLEPQLGLQMKEEQVDDLSHGVKAGIPFSAFNQRHKGGHVVNPPDA